MSTELNAAEESARAAQTIEKDHRALSPLRPRRKQPQPMQCPRCGRKMRYSPKEGFECNGCGCILVNLS